jgi:hypothetical protein
MWRPCMACAWWVGSFWSLTNLHLIINTILVARDTIISSTIFFLMCGMWLNASDIECTYISFITIAHHEAWLLMKFEFCQPIEFESVT